ncbi:MAG: hypothetical protein J6Y92_08005 [Lentisphaeria bacterium]|nr:hypothetical protein [Lentisphaeria bacterium]
MKILTRFLKSAVAAFVLCAGLAAFAQDERYSQIPDGAALVMNLNLNKLYSSPTFKAVAESGDVLGIRDDLKAIPWNKAGTLPDPVIVYAPEMGESYAILVGTDKTPDELFNDIGKKNHAVSEKKGTRQRIILKEPHRNRKTNRQELRNAGEILFLSPKTVAYGRKKNPLDLAFFSTSPLPAAEFTMIQNAPAEAVAVGILRRFPVAAADDPTGLSALVNSGDFIVSEYEPGAASLVLNMNCKGEKEAQLAARRAKSFLQITLVSLFALDKNLFKELNSSYTATSSGNKAKLEVKLPKATLDKVRSYYLMEQALTSAAGIAVDIIGAAIK